MEITGAASKVDDNNNGVIFATTYMPPDTPLPKSKEAVEVIETFLDYNPHSKHHLSGDMNLSTDTVSYLKDENENLFPVIQSCRDDMNTDIHQKSERAHIIFNMNDKRGLVPIVDKAVRGKNILDIIFTKTCSRGINVVEANELSDNNVIINHTDLTAPAKEYKADDDSPEIKRLDTRKMNINKCKILLANTNWHQELSNMKAHDQKERLIQLLTEKMKEAGATSSAPRGKAKAPRPLKSY